jgi:hypothetical protein
MDKVELKKDPSRADTRAVGPSILGIPRSVPTMMPQTEDEILRIHQEITTAFEESTRANNADWLHYFWQIMMEDSNLSRQEIIDLMLDELNRGNSCSKDMLRSILEHGRE